MGGGKKPDAGEDPKLDAVRRQKIFEQSIEKELSIVRGQSKFQINPLIKDRKGNSKNLSTVLPEKPNRRGLDKYAERKHHQLERVPEGKSYERQQVDRLRALPMDGQGVPSTTSQEVGWLLGVAMRMKEGRASPSGSAPLSARSNLYTIGSPRKPPGTPRAPWSARGSTAGSSSAFGDSAAGESSYSEVSLHSTPYDFSRPNTSGGMERYFRPKSRSDVVTFADVFSQKTGSHPYVRPKTPAAETTTGKH